MAKPETPISPNTGRHGPACDTFPSWATEAMPSRAPALWAPPHADLLDRAVPVTLRSGETDRRQGGEAADRVEGLGVGPEDRDGVIDVGLDDPERPDAAGPAGVAEAA